MRESRIEGRLRRTIRKFGGRFYKWVSPGEGGVPDRIAITPAGRIVFVELKTLTGRASELQKEQARRLRESNCDERHIYGREEAEALLRDLFPEYKGGEPN